jgi:hypothetical protein
MKPKPRDYFTIGAALLAILLCGYGIGFLVGEHATQQRLVDSKGSGAGEQQDWESITLERLSDELVLTVNQKPLVLEEIRTTAGEISEAREKALGDYRQSLVDLHKRLLPHLTEAQRKRVEESLRQMEMLDKKASMPDGSPD